MQPGSGNGGNWAARGRADCVAALAPRTKPETSAPPLASARRAVRSCGRLSLVQSTEMLRLE